MKIIKPELPPPPLAVQFEEIEVTAILEDLEDYNKTEVLAPATMRFMKVLRDHIGQD